MNKYNRLGYFIGEDIHLRSQIIYDDLTVGDNFVTNPGGAAEAGEFVSGHRIPKTLISPGSIRVDGYGSSITPVVIEGTKSDSGGAFPSLTLSRRGFNGSDGDEAGTLVFECPLDDSTEGTPIAAFNANWSDVSNKYARLCVGIKSFAKLPPGAGLVSTSTSYGRIIEGVATGATQIDVLLALGTGSTTTVAGDLTIGGSDLTFDGVALTGIQTSGESFSNDDVSLMTSAAIEDKILSYGYSTTSGDITGVTIGVGSGLDITESNTTGGDYSATINLDLTEVGVSGSANQLLTDDGDGTITSEANATYDGTDLNLTSGTSAKPELTIQNSNTDAVGSILKFEKTATGANNDKIGKIQFQADDNADQSITFAEIEGSIYNATATGSAQAGQLQLQVRQTGSLANILKGYTLGLGSTLEFGDGGLLATASFNCTLINFTSSFSTGPIFAAANTTEDANGPEFTFIKNRGGSNDSTSTLDGDNCGTFNFRGFDDGAGIETYADIKGYAVETSAGNEAGKIQLRVCSDGNGSTNARNVITGTGHTTTDKVDVDLGYGSASTVTIPGGISIGGHTVNDIDVAGEFVDSDEHLMTAAAINDRIAAVGGGGGGGSSKVHVSIMNPISYLFYLFNDDSWYSAGTTTLALLGSSSSPSDISSSNSEYGARIALYTAPAACTVNKLTFNWYWTSSTLSGAKAFEFAFSKYTPVNGASTITMNSITATDHNSNYTEFIGYQQTFTFSGGNATLAAGDAIAMHMRTTDGSSSQRVLVYGTITLEAELS